MFKYTLKNIVQDDIVCLFRNNHSLFCPLNSDRYVIQCGSWCPHFDIEIDDKGSKIVTMSCSGSLISYTIEE